ncbi:hypothetical protein D3C86_1272100 [compost metagenome]
MTALEQHVTHGLARRQVTRQLRALACLERRIKLEEIHPHFAVHDDGELVVRCGVPRRLAFGAQGFNHVAEVEADDDFFIRKGFFRHFENVRKGVVAGLAADDLDRAFAVVVQRAEDCFDCRATHGFHRFVVVVTVSQQYVAPALRTIRGPATTVFAKRKH